MAKRTATQVQRQQQYRGRMKRSGFKELILWVHEDDKDEMRKHAKKLRMARQDDANPLTDEQDWLS